MLELGALDGYFSKHLAETHKAQCTAVDDNPHLQESPGVTVVQDRLSATAIRKLGPFDVALCLSVLHHLPQWKATLNALLDAAPVVIVESAHPDEALPKAGNHKASADILAAIENVGGPCSSSTAPNLKPKPTLATCSNPHLRSKGGHRHRDLGVGLIWQVFVRLGRQHHRPNPATR